MEMPKYHAYIACSLDGFIAGDKGNLDFLNSVETPGEDYGYYKFYNSIDTIVMGSGTYQTAVNFHAWPYSEKRCIVCTSKERTPKHNEEFWQGSIEDLNEYLRSCNAKKIYVDGGRMISSFLKSGFLEHLTVSVIPVLLGKGIPLFSGVYSNKKIILQRCESYSSGLVQLEYNIPDQF